MVKLAFHTQAIDPGLLSPYGDFTLPARLFAGEAETLGLRLLERGSTVRASGSLHLDAGAAAEIIARRNPNLAPPTAETRYIIAGQQVGLLTGPLYTFLKAVTAIALARDLSVRTSQDVRPLFWMASEDHDVLEVNRVMLGGERFVHEFPGPIARGRMPQVADIALDDAREPLLAFVEGALPPTEFTASVRDWIAAADFTTYATAFRDLIAALFRAWDLYLVDPIDLRPLTGPALAALVERWDQVEIALARGRVTLKDHGFSPPLERAGFYEIAVGFRRPVEITGETMHLTRGACTFAAAAAEIRAHPERFSPGAALRPICQDAALPVIATIGGPAELLYLWQIEPIAEVIGLTPSRRATRISATFLEPKVIRAAEKLGLPPERIFEAAQLGEISEEVDPIAQAIEDRSAQLLAALDQIAHSPPPRWLRSGQAAIESGTAKIIAGLYKERLESQGRGTGRIEKITRRILPGGKPQERGENIAWFLNLYGPDFVRCAIEELDPWARGHTLVSLAT